MFVAGTSEVLWYILCFGSAHNVHSMYCGIMWACVQHFKQVLLWDSYEEHHRWQKQGGLRLKPLQYLGLPIGPDGRHTPQAATHVTGKASWVWACKYTCMHCNYIVSKTLKSALYSTWFKGHKLWNLMGLHLWDLLKKVASVEVICSGMLAQISSVASLQTQVYRSHPLPHLLINLTAPLMDDTAIQAGSL